MPGRVLGRTFSEMPLKATVSSATNMRIPVSRITRYTGNLPAVWKIYSAKLVSAVRLESMPIMASLPIREISTAK